MQTISLAQSHAQVNAYLACEALLNRFFRTVNFCRRYCVNQSEPNEFMDDLLMIFNYGCGCCTAQYSKDFPDSLSAAEVLLRQQRIELYGFPEENYVLVDMNSRTGEKDALDICRYHTQDEGCTLRSHKDPVCIAFVCGGYKKFLTQTMEISYDDCAIQQFFQRLLTEKVSSREISLFRSKIKKFTELSELILEDA